MDRFLMYILWGSGVAMLLHVWFKSKAFVEYLTLLDLGDFFHVDEYVGATVDDPATTYPEYIVATHPGFFTKLFSCPKCLAFQINLWTAIPLFMFLQVTVTWLCWVLYPVHVLVSTYFSLFMYHLLNKMMKHE